MNAHVKPVTPFSVIGKAVLANGYRPIPIRPGSKTPGEVAHGIWKEMFGWPKFRDQEPGPFHLSIWSTWQGAGVGIVLGNEIVEGWEVACIDHDTDDFEIQDMVDSVLPRSIVEKRGRRGFSGFYLVPAKTKGARWKRGSETVLELLTGTNTRQTVLPPSMHPDTGMPYRWLTKRTLIDTPAAELPRLDADTLERLFDTMSLISGVEAAKGPRVEPEGVQRADGGSVFGAVKTAALRRLDDWVPALGLVRCRRTASGYEAVPHWRAGGTGKSMAERKLSLKIHPNGVRDFGADKGLSPIDLVMRALTLDFGDALAWLEDMLGLTPEPWGDFPFGEVASEDTGTPVAVPKMMTADEARAAIEHKIQAHIEAGLGVRAIKVGTGLGKTSIAVRLIAQEVRRLRSVGDKGIVLFSVPTHKLGDTIVEQFVAQGIAAKSFRGRGAPDPAKPGSKMCNDMEAVDTALALTLNVSTACCDGVNPKTGTGVRCKFFDECAYQRQTDIKPDVWVVAHQLLFVASSGLGNVKSVFVDESFWSGGVWAAKGGLSIDEIGAAPLLRSAWLDDTAADVAEYRAKLARALRRQERPGGVTRSCLVAEGLTAEECSAAARAEWALAEPPTVYPGMPTGARKQAAAVAAGMKHIRARSVVWNAARALLANEDETAVSGRLVLDDVNTKMGLVRVAKSRGVKPIASQWAITTMLMDATLPDLSILGMLYADVEVVAEIEADMPHATIRQVVHAPVSSGKLTKSTAERNLHSIRRGILHRFVEYGRQPTLVVAQKAVSEWLIETGMPEGISFEHFNAVAGLDQYRDIRLLITVGRTMPTVFDVEGLSGALTGSDPVKTPEPCEAGHARWYEKPAKVIRFRDGQTYPIGGERHPDTTAEAVRWQICEAELIQAIGRGRGVNRTAETPLAIEVWSDVVLPLGVDEVVKWSDVPSDADAEMVASGVVLTSPSDMAKCWPKVWETEKAAKSWREKLTEPLNPIRESPIGSRGRVDFRYQHPGPRRKWRSGSYEPGVVANPRAWLEERLGVTLADFALVQ